MAQTVAQKNRAIRQQALRDQLAAQGHEQHLREIQKEIAGLDPKDPNCLIQLKKLEASAAISEKLLRKYLPDLKSVELTGEGGGAVEISDAERARKLASLLDGARARRAGSNPGGSAVDTPAGPAE